MRPVIQGVGVVGGFGCGTEALSQVLADQDSRTQKASIKTTQGPRQIPVFLADTSRLEDFVNKKALRRIDHYSKLALLGAYLALEDAGQLDGDRHRMGMIIATGYGDCRTTFAFMNSFIDGGDKLSSPTYFSTSIHNAAVANISMLMGITGPGLTVSQFEMSVPSALLAVINWLEEGRVDSILFGAIDEYCDILGYCWHRFFGDPGEAGQGMRPLSFNLQSAVPGEGAAFFLLTRGENSSQSPYGFIKTVEMERCNKNKLELPEEVILIINADGHRKCGKYYKQFLPEKVPTACYSPLYGSLPVGPAFDLAVAALTIKNNKVFPSFNHYCDHPGILIVSEEQTLGNRPICCLKIGGDGEWGKIILAPSL